MKQEDVTALAGLFNVTAEDVKAADENGGLSELINGFTTSTKLIPMKDYPTLESNLKRQAFMELDKTNLPKEVFTYVKGAVLEQTEKGLAKKHGIESYQNLDDLVEAIITTKTKPASDDETKKLKDRIVELEVNHKSELENVSKTFNNRFIDTELNRAISELPIEAEGAKLDNQQEIVRAMVKSKFNFAIENDKIVTLKDGKPVTDVKLDPIPLKEVVYGFAKDYVNLRPEQGGRGDKSSTNGSREIDFEKYCIDNGIKPNSVEMVKARRDLETKGYTFK
jgi:hypothetical protein